MVMADATKWMAIPMKHVPLVTLVLQNSALVLLMHYSRVMPLIGGHRYFTSTAVFLNEVLKLAICLTVALYDVSRNLPPSTPATTLFSTLYNSACTVDSWRLVVPACLYTLQNSLQYIALSNMDAANFQVSFQLTILTSSLFGVALLGRSLSIKKWLALFLLAVGVAISQVPSPDSTLSPLKDAQSRLFFPRSLDGVRIVGRSMRSTLAKRSATYEGIQEDQGLETPQLNPLLGLVAVVLAAVAGGLASTYLEKIVKEAPSSQWIRNVQLSFYSIFPAFIVGVVMIDGEALAQRGFFDGYNWVVWTVISTQALGGVVVGLCANYADGFAKSFASSISILVSVTASLWLSDFGLTTNFIMGTGLVMFATYLYNCTERPRPPPINIAGFEKTAIGAMTPREERQEPDLLRTTGLSTSRPNSPMRHHSRVASGRMKVGKRGD